MIKEDDKDKDVQESFEYVYKDENDDDVELHVKGVQKLSLEFNRSIDDLQWHGLIQSLCKVSSQSFEIVVDCQYNDNFNLRDMVNGIKLPPQIHVAPHTVVWNNPLVGANASENYVIDIAGLKYKNTTIFDNFDVIACQLVLGTPYQFDLNLCHKSREKTIDNDGKYVLYPLEDKIVLNPYFKRAVFGTSIIGFKEVEVGSNSKLAMVNQDVVGFIQVLLSQTIDLVEEFRYKITTRPLHVQVPPWRDKQ